MYKEQTRKEYAVHTITSRQQLKDCPIFHVDNFQWRNVVKPKTWGRMGYLLNEGLFIEMTTEEIQPKREFHLPMDPVWQDSAMEAFFAFPDRPLLPGKEFSPKNDGLYFNFEVNANGAMYANYGYGRNNRKPFTPEEFSTFRVSATVHPTQWSIYLIVPMPIIQQRTGLLDFEPGDVFYCNFYKISEDKSIEHYGSFSPLASDTPNFHLPESFAKATILPAKQSKE